MRRHSRSPTASGGTSHQQKTATEINAVAAAWRTSREASQALAATEEGDQAFWGGAVTTGSRCKIISEVAVRRSRYWILPCTSSIWPRMFVSSRSTVSVSSTLLALS